MSRTRKIIIASAAILGLAGGTAAMVAPAVTAIPVASAPATHYWD